MKKDFYIELGHGNVEGVCYEANNEGPLVLITNGMNGFYNYSFFPYLQEEFMRNKISSISYNFSHGGIVGENKNNCFERPDLYEKNCIRLEIKDLEGIFENLDVITGQNSKNKNRKLILLSHSLGNFPTVFAAINLLELSYQITEIVFLAPSDRLRFWNDDDINKWEKEGRLIFPYDIEWNKQEKPFMGREFLDEVLNTGKWDLEANLKNLPVKYLIVHGKEDKSIDKEESQNIQNWIRNYNYECQLELIENADHVFNCEHGKSVSSPEINTVIKKIIDWISYDS